MQHLLMLKYLTTQKTLGTVKLWNLSVRINVMGKAMAMVCTQVLRIVVVMTTMKMMIFIVTERVLVRWLVESYVRYKYRP